METKQKPLHTGLKLLGNIIGWMLQAALLVILALFFLMVFKVVERWNKPMVIPEAHGMTYGELIHNRFDGWNANQEEYGESTLHCKAFTFGGIVLSFPHQFLYTYVGIYPNSSVKNFIDPRDVQAGFIPEHESWLSLPDSWWWVVEKFSWGIFVSGVQHSGSKLCRLPAP